ncbi:MAG TPA: rhomboid family intramembrane serine protease [Rhodoglobus sp.]|nr:rhomboid family intramembrane serine protease [Rhodoglobus sp.]
MSAPQGERSADTCYRHPDRPSYVLCQRCGRTICPECQTQAAVGVQCPECVREGRASMPRRSMGSRMSGVLGRAGDRPVVTLTLIAVTAVAFVLQQLVPAVEFYGVYRPGLTLLLPWTPITSVFLHGGIVHLALNMLALFVLGPALEQLLGRARFLALYLIAGLGGTVAVALLNPGGAVLGASGAIFGLFGAYFVVSRSLGAANPQILVVIGLNLVAGFIIPGISWQAHVGGLLAGCAAAAILLATRRRQQRTQQVLLIAALAVALVVILVLRVLSL